MSYPGSTFPEDVGISDGPNLDPFSRVRVSYPHLQFSTLFDTADRTLYWDGTVAGAGTATYHPSSGTMRLAVTAAAGDRVVRQSKEFYSYRAAQGQLVLATFLMAPPQANMTQKVGYFNGAEGMYLEVRDNDDPEMVIRSVASGATTYERIPQSSWNMDPLDGTGPSGITLDLTKTQIWVCDFQWLGVGRVRMGFDIDGMIIYVHEFKHANQGGNTLPYIRSPKLPVRYEIENTGATAGPTELMQICSAVNREGAVDEPGAQRSVWSQPDSGTGLAATSTTLTTILGIRLQAANIHATLRALEHSFINLDTEALLWCLVLNPGGTGAAVWADVPGADSIAQYSRSQIAVGVNGSGLPNGARSLVLSSGVLGGGAQSRGNAVSGTLIESVPVVSAYDGTPDELWVCARLVTGSGEALSTLTYKEIR